MNSDASPTSTEPKSVRYFLAMRTSMFSQGAFRLCAIGVFALLGLSGCSSTGACIQAGTPGSNIHTGSCTANATSSTCAQSREFVAGDAQASAALCRARGFTRVAGTNGANLTPAEVDAALASGAPVSFFTELPR